MANSLNIVVLGGLVMDLIWEVPDWPTKGRAVQATRFRMQPGGKGLNQAIAAARLGANVTVISAVGPDYIGDRLLEELDNEGIDLTLVERNVASDTDATGVIVENGEPGFIGAKIASQTISSKLLNRAEPYIKRADVIMATGEIQPHTIKAAFEFAKKNNVVTLMNPAPPERLEKELLSITDYLIPNFWEGSVVAGLDKKRNHQIDSFQIIGKLRRMGANNVILTRGEGGSTYSLVGESGYEFEEPVEVEAQDTTGASDAFCAGLAVGLASGKQFEDAMLIATAAGAMACLTFGASTSMPKKAALNEFLKRNKFKISID